MIEFLVIILIEGTALIYVLVYIDIIVCCILIVVGLSHILLQTLTIGNELILNILISVHL